MFDTVKCNQLCLRGFNSYHWFDDTLGINSLDLYGSFYIRIYGFETSTAIDYYIMVDKI